MAKTRTEDLLLKTQVGRKLCKKLDNGTSICVEGRKYGFTGHLIGISGKGPGLPVSTHSPKTAEPARTAEQALKNAEAFVASVRTKRN